MSLTKEWLNRITHWDHALWQICYEPLEKFELNGFVTHDQLTAEQASKRKFHPMPVGTNWGAKWQYGWFKCDLTLPEAAAGRRIVMYMNPAAKPDSEDGECLVWANGKVIGSYGWARREITLTKNGIPGANYLILVEAYAGHGSLVMGGGPILYDHASVPEPGKTQATVGESHFGIWREQVYQLAIDYATLFELRNRLDPTSLRVSEIDEGLKDVTLLIDLELPEPEMLESINQARDRLHPLLSCVNGTSTPTFYAFGHAHIDVAWLWPLAETNRKIARTAINQLSLMEEYPEYRFLQSQPQLYTMLKARYPELYERFKQAVLSGKVITDAAMWVEADTNISAGESLIRQIMYAKQFLKEEFSKDVEVMWLPDVFGYTGSLPQIMLQCGCTSFATQKIAWTYHGGEPFPYNTFLWEGIDGSCIPTHIFTDYNSETRPGNILDRWESRFQKDGIDSMLLAFGWGDGGGGPTRDHLEFISRSKDLEGLPKIKLSSPGEFFADLKREGKPKEKYFGELYFQAHRGAFTSQAKTKLGNRRSEIALHEAEFWGTIAHQLTRYGFSAEKMKPVWRKLLLNQFHDILPGSSIHRVYEEAAAVYENIIADAKRITKAALKEINKSQPKDKVTVFNSLSWERNELLNFPEGMMELKVPACGWKTINLKDIGQQSQGKRSQRVKISETSLENELLVASFNSRGELISLIDKETNMEMMAGVGNRFCLFKDIPARFDAWDIDSMTELLQMPTEEPVTVDISESGDYVAKLKLTRKIHLSSITQLITLRKGKRRLDFETRVDWQESHKLLKVAFLVNIYTKDAIHEIQFGHIRRPNHRSRPFDRDRFEVCNHRWTALTEENRGIAILNDSKYGINVLENSMNLTLLKSALAPDPMADKGIQTFTYSIFYWMGSFSDSDVVREGYELNYPVLVQPGDAGEASIFSLDAANIVLETVKMAEDGSEDIIVRLYEAKRNSTRCSLSTKLPVIKAIQTDMLEKNLKELTISHGKIELDFRPFEIKTVRLILESKVSR
jgi:alpha-mannosidase